MANQTLVGFHFSLHHFSEGGTENKKVLPPFYDVQKICHTTSDTYLIFDCCEFAHTQEIGLDKSMLKRFAFA